MKNNKIKTLRNSNRWSQEMLARKLKVSRSTIASWESGVTEPNIMRLIQLSQLFKTSIDEIVNNTKSDMKNLELQIVVELFNLNVSDKTKVLTFITQLKNKNGGL